MPSLPPRSVRRLLAGITLLLAATPFFAAPPKIVLLGSASSHSTNEHDSPTALTLVSAWLQAAPEFKGAETLIFSASWPSDPSMLDGASTIVLYSDSAPDAAAALLGPEARAKLQQLLDAGAGLVWLPRSTTLTAPGAVLPPPAWLGLKNTPAFASANGPARPGSAARAHPVANGLGVVEPGPGEQPAATWSSLPAGLTPILQPDTVDAGRTALLAWTAERAGGGRVAVFLGNRTPATLARPTVRKLVLNAIAWTAGLTVPSEGIDTSGPVLDKARVVRKGEWLIVSQTWGEIRWLASSLARNSRTMSVGFAIVAKGQANPRHYHPNCDEILHVLQGRVRHTMNEVTVVLEAGDTVIIPAGTLHNATNLGDGEAVLSVSFSSAYRVAEGEQ